MTTKTTRKGIALVRRHADRRRYLRIIEKYLSDCYARRTVVRVSELAQLLGAPRPYLSKVVLQLFGKPLRALLREKQLEEAKRLLQVTPLGLDAIASASGFGHRSTFHRLFHGEFGVTPTEYRRKARNPER